MVEFWTPLTKKTHPLREIQSSSVNPIPWAMHAAGNSVLHVAVETCLPQLEFVGDAH